MGKQQADAQAHILDDNDSDGNEDSDEDEGTDEDEDGDKDKGGDKDEEGDKDEANWAEDFRRFFWARFQAFTFQVSHFILYTQFWLSYDILFVLYILLSTVTIITDNMSCISKS